MVKVHEKACLRRPGDDPLNPRLRKPSPFVPQGEGFREGFCKIEQNLFVKLFKSLAPGRAAGGVFNLAASGGKVSHLESWLPSCTVREALPPITHPASQGAHPSTDNRHEMPKMQSRTKL